jgi:NhaP-type Na+/H+ or K+/H+ antiporter
MLSAVMVYYILGYQEKDGFNFITCCMFGSIISATDPVAVVSLLKQLGASKRLSTMIEGESLLNDGTAMVAFTVFMDLAGSNPKYKTAGDVIVEFLKLVLGAFALATAWGILSDWWMMSIGSNYILETNLVIVASYLLFFTAEAEGVKFSGILAIVVYGIFMAYDGRYTISVESHHAHHHIWGYVGFVAETLIFFLAGLTMGSVIQKDKKGLLIDNSDIGKAIAAWLILILIRTLCVFAFFPCLKRMGYGFTYSEAIMVSYGGLRGAVGLALAMIVHDDEKLK